MFTSHQDKILILDSMKSGVKEQKTLPPTYLPSSFRAFSSFKSHIEGLHTVHVHTVLSVKPFTQLLQVPVFFATLYLSSQGFPLKKCAFLSAGIVDMM